MKKIKYFLLGILSITIIIVVGALIKYNVDLNRFIDQESANNPKIEAKKKGAVVHIVGTVHFETEAAKRQDLYEYINQVSPSVILYESDSSTLMRLLNGRDYFFQLVDVFRNSGKMEKPVVLKYLTHNPDCQVLPYEWELRDKFHQEHDFRSRSREMINSIIRLNRDNGLTSEQSKDVNRFLELTKKLNKLGLNDLETINGMSTDSIVRERQFYTYQEIPKLVFENEELSEYQDFVKIHMDYWKTRNDAMVQNILKQIKRHPNSTIVVLNGFYHRYYFIDELKKYEKEYHFSLK